MKRRLPNLSIITAIVLMFSSFASLFFNISSAHAEGSWVPMDVPQVGSNSLNAIDAISETDMWAVGGTYENSQGKALIMHWDGSIWKVFPSPGISGGSYTLKAIDARVSNDVWAVGYHNDYVNNAFTSGMLTMHWDGTEWKVVVTPFDNKSNSNELNSVYIVSENDVWAVGTDNIKAVILHWNGQEWSNVTTDSLDQSPFVQSSLKDIYGTSANDIWAVGSQNDKSLTLHWDGTKWSAWPSPNGKYANAITGVIGFGSNNYWAYGNYADDNNLMNDTVLRFDGNAWQATPSHFVNKRYLFAFKISGTSESNMWVTYEAGDSYNEMRAGSVHFNGHDWQSVTVPQLGDYVNDLKDIVTPSENTAYGVGSYSIGTEGKSMILKYQSSLPSLTPTVAPTISVSPSPTPTILPTSTPTPTPTPVVNVPITFTNVKLVSVTKDQATMSWTTNTPATTKAQYGRSFFFLTSIFEDKLLVTAHEVTLKNLISRRTYYVKFSGSNIFGKQYSSKLYYFTTH